jgi:hypothetical protein
VPSGSHRPDRSKSQIDPTRWFAGWRFRTRIKTAALRERFRVTHISLQRTHVHMLVEAEAKTALARGMQGFQISAARNINTALGDGTRRRRGKVFADRYHLEVITSPTRARHAIGYVLSNWRKHGEDRAGLPSTWLVDPFSSGISFPDWKELDDKAWMWPIRHEAVPAAKAGRNRDAYAAVIASFIGILALAISGYTAYVQRQQLRAQVWPHLRLEFSGVHRSFSAINQGTGPRVSPRCVSPWTARPSEPGRT